MDVLLPFILAAGLFVALELLWGRQAWPDPPAEVRAEFGQTRGLPAISPDWGLFGLPFVRLRLDALAAELERLEHDELIFAKAFRYRAAKSAYEALLEDASRLAEASRLADACWTVEDLWPVDAEISAAAIPASRGPMREELEL
jgi:hypothetical protein